MRLSTLFAFLRHRWLWWFLGALVTFPVLVLVLCYLWLLPNLPAYKDDIASLLSSATGYTITLERIHGERGGAHPRLLLEGVRIAKDGHPLLHFSKIDGRLGWRTLLTLEPRFHSLVVEAPALTVRRTSDGMFQVGGLRTDPNSTDTAFSDWLLKQGSVSLQGATIAWINDQHASPPLVMRNVGFKLQSLFTRHAFEVDMTPPAWLSKPLQIKGVMYGRSLSKRQNWHGALKLNLSALEMAAWRPWLPAEYTEVRGHGGLTGTLSVQHGRLTEANFNLNLADLNMRLPQLSSPMELASIKGELGWKRETHDAHEITTLHVRNLSLNSRNGVKLAPFDFSWRRGDGEQTVTAKHLPLGQLTAIANELPLSSTHKAELRTLALKGLINSLDISWHDQPGQQIALPEVFSVDVRFTGLGWAAEGQRPGAANLSGNLSGNEKKGHYLLTGTQAGFDLPAVFADPALRFDHMNMRGGWTRHASQGQQPHINIDIAEALLSNADVTARLHGQYRLLENGPGYADLSGNVERGKAARVVRYLPLSINSMTHDWLRSSVLQGEIREGSFKLQGDLARFPFRSKQDGIFQVYGRFDAGLLRYAHNYPAINDIDGEFIMDGIRLEVRSDKARVFGAQLRKVTAAINDFASAKELLEIKGEAHGPMTEFLRFVNFSPVAETLENLTEEITANGDARLQLNIKIPLRHVQNATTSGRLSFLDNTIYPGADIPRIEHVNGQLDFTERAIIAPKITAHILGGPAALNINTENQQVRILGHGVFHAAALESWLGKAAAARLSGQSRWQGELNIGGGKNRMRFESNLAGLELRLPAPLRKPAATASLLAFDMQATDSGTRLSHLQYGNIASAAWASTPSASGYRMARGELRFGGKAKLPNTPGLQIAGTVGNFDLGGWTDLLPEDANGQSALMISSLNLHFLSLDFLGRRLNDINIDAKLRGNLLRAAINGREMSGNLTYRRSGEGPTRLSAQFKNFTLPEPTQFPVQQSDAPTTQLNAASFPAVDLQIDDLKLGDQALGKLDVIAHGVTHGLAIDQLNLTHADSVIRMSGLWKDTGKGETRMKVDGEIKNIGLMLARFGFADAVKRGSATIGGDVTWLGSPADFTFKTLDGTLSLRAQNGQFLKVRPGAGKLLGIASLQSLPRRISLDFRDVFSDGFAFDEISSNMQLARGELYTNDFLMKGPAATVKMSGVASLQKETVKLRVKIVPKLSEGVAVAGALLGGPIAGLGALVIQKVLKDPIEQAIAFEYLVDGGWEDPTVTRLSKPKAEKEPKS